MASLTAVKGASALALSAALALGISGPALAAPDPTQPDVSVPTSPITPSSPSPKPSASAGPATYATKVPSPRRLAVPALGIDTKIYSSGLDKYRNVQIPEDINKVGWYRYGVPPGVNRGAAVIVGHRDGRGYRKGAFYNLGTLNPGQVITVTTSRKQELKYRITKVRSILKKRLPFDRIFAVDGRHRLVLISCGGAYIRSKGGYQDNVVVTAEPLFTPIKVAPARS